MMIPETSPHQSDLDCLGGGSSSACEREIFGGGRRCFFEGESTRSIEGECVSPRGGGFGLG